MKRVGKISASILCVLMCCLFCVQYVAAETVANWSISSAVLYSIVFRNVSTGELKSVSQNKNGVISGSSISFSSGASIAAASQSSFNWSAVFQLYGSFDHLNDVLLPSPDDYLWLSFSVDVSFVFDSRYTGVLDFDRLFDCDMSLVGYWPGGSKSFTDVTGISQVSDTEYILSFLIPSSLLDGDLIHIDHWSLTLPIQPKGTNVGLSNSVVINSILLNITNFTLTYEIPASTIIISGLENIGESLDNLASSVESGFTQTITEIKATQDIIEQLPDALRDLVVGEEYTGSLDTSELAGYESDLAAVKDKVDIDGVKDVLSSGVSLDGGDNYNQQSLGKVGDFMNELISASGLAPLISVTLTIGLACFVIGRTKNLR